MTIGIARPPTPSGRLWIIFHQSMAQFGGRSGVGVAICEPAEARKNPRLRRIALAPFILGAILHQDHSTVL
jgi:hypothetical protein